MSQHNPIPHGQGSPCRIAAQFRARSGLQFPLSHTIKLSSRLLPHRHYIGAPAAHFDRHYLRVILTVVAPAPILSRSFPGTP